MTQTDLFKNAKWVGAADRTQNGFSVLRGRFRASAGAKAKLRLLGLGFFKCYINGICINPDTFLPLSSDFEAGCEPSGEIFSGHRVYVPEFDITYHLKEGENLIAIHYGGGWYTFRKRPFGLPKAIYLISVEESGRVRNFVSDESCRIRAGYVSEYDFVKLECQDLTLDGRLFSPDTDDSGWDRAVEVEPLVSEYCQSDCPPDRLIASLPVKEIGRSDGGVIYDCGKNLTGYPVLSVGAPRGERVSVRFSEELSPDGTLDRSHVHGQTFSVVSRGERDTVQPEFTWFGFRYFEVSGDAEPLCVKLVHADVRSASSFECDNETLNWIYHIFMHTMLCNMHTGHPSDCPHLERRGYTGDGQLTCHAVLSVFDARAFYEKWLRDIADGQDTVSGHIQYTAPYIRSGGGPGGWGCAIVEVPYLLYRHYGNEAYLTEYYQNMRRYIDYLEAHSEFGLVVSDREGEWCLGDWCGPNILYTEKDITSHNQQVVLPAPMVNTYFMVRSLERMREIARIIGADGDIPEYEKKIDERKRAIRAAYFNTFDGNFIMNVQGANAYAVDLGLGDASTYPNMVNYYRKLGHYDTGIFATDILTRVLFERGDDELALDLLTHDGDQGYEHWRKSGATTFHEYWDSNRSRSHNHPMFGAPVAYIFDYLLGIRQDADSAGYASITVSPRAVTRFGYMRGSMETPHGTISVGYERCDGKVFFSITVPSGVSARFEYQGRCESLREGENEITIAESAK